MSLLSREGIVSYKNYLQGVVLLKYGTLSIIMGRLIPAVRSLVPLMVGVSHLNKIKFTAIDTLACAIWSTGLYLLAGGIGSVFI